MGENNLNAQHSFDAYCKKIIINQAKDIWRSEKYRREKFRLFSDMSVHELEYALAELPEEYTKFIVYGYEVLIRENLLVEAIERLDGKKQKIILLYYFVGFRDGEIARLLKLSRSAVQNHRAEATKRLAKHLRESDEGKRNDVIGDN